MPRSKLRTKLKRSGSSNCVARSPEEVVITEVLSPTFADGSSTPNNEPSDDFFSSWDKPAIKRPSNPPSRSQTPTISRTGSPFLNAKTNSTDSRSKSPASGAEADTAAPNASRTSSAALRKTATTGGARKANVLGAKKNQKLGVKKVAGAETIDFDAAEKKAREEAERIEKLGYDPNAEEAVPESSVTSPVEKTKIVSPIPVSPPRAGLGSSQNQGHQRSPSELERLGMGMGRLGFGQVGGNKSSAPASRKLGFGAVGGSKPAAESTFPSGPLPTQVTMAPAYALYRR